MSDGFGPRAETLAPEEIAEALGLYPPTPEQAAVVAGALDPTLVVAGAGAGKTETMASRVVWLVANGLARPAEVLGLTFTRKAAQQLSRRIRRRLDELAHSPLCSGSPHATAIAEVIRTTDPLISTYHAYAGTLLGAYGLLVPVEPDAELLSETAVFRLAHEVVSRWETPLTTTTGAGWVTGLVLDLAGQLAEHLVTTDDLRACPDDLSTLVATLPPGPGQRKAPTKNLVEWATAQGFRAELTDLVDAVAARLRAEGGVDFGAQMSLAAAMARDHAQVGEAERRTSRVVLLDEYQDTGYSQRVLLSSLFGGGVTPVPAVTAVGDPMQAIYGWRGASATNLELFRTDFPRADGSPARVLELTTSWRNPPEILDLANRVTDPLREAAGAVPVPVLRSRPGATPGEVSLAVFDTVDEEREWVADRVAEEVRRAREAGRTPTAAVLVRRNKDSVPIAEKLRARGVPVEIVGVGGLLDVPEVADVLALLTVVARPSAGPQLLRLLTGSRFALGPADLEVLARRASELSLRRSSAVAVGELTGLAEVERLFDEIAGGEDVDSAGLADALADPGPAERYSAEGARRIAELSGIVAALRRRVGTPPARLVAAAEQALGLDVETRLRARADGGDGREHLDALHAAAARWGSGVTAGLEAFLDHLELSRDVERGLPTGESAAVPGRVQILTVHTAKGLEWDVVAVPHVTKGVFPGGRTPPTAVRVASQIPDVLRGDRATEDSPGGAPVPRLDDVVDRKQLEAALEAHVKRVTARSVDEDRRLFYVALTRSERRLLVSASYWEEGVAKPKGPSEFFTGLLDQCAGPGAPGRVEHLCEEPSASNPSEDVVVEAEWPRPSDTGPRAAGAELVRRARALDPEAEPLPGGARERRRQLDAAALLAERRAAEEARGRVELPRRLTASELVQYASDPGAFTARLRRPLPFRPDRFARRGTRFHAWLEHRFGASHLLDLDELPGAGDDTGEDERLAELQEAFEASSWALRTPAEVEIPFEVSIGGHLLRGRMDAVFEDGDGWVVVDWKTGAVPTASQMPAVALQLAVYRYAWARVVSARRGVEVPLTDVRAAFHYVRENRTVEPGGLPDAEGLRALLDGGATPAGEL